MAQYSSFKQITATTHVLNSSTDIVSIWWVSLHILGQFGNNLILLNKGSQSSKKSVGIAKMPQ